MKKLLLNTLVSTLSIGTVAGITAPLTVQYLNNANDEVVQNTTSSLTLTHIEAISSHEIEVGLFSWIDATVTEAKIDFYDVSNQTQIIYTHQISSTYFTTSGEYTFEVSLPTNTFDPGSSYQGNLSFTSGGTQYPSNFKTFKLKGEAPILLPLTVSPEISSAQAQVTIDMHSSSVNPPDLITSLKYANVVSGRDPLESDKNDIPLDQLFSDQSGIINHNIELLNLIDSTSYDFYVWLEVDSFLVGQDIPIQEQMFSYTTSPKHVINQFDVIQQNPGQEHNSAELLITDTGSTPEALSSIELMYIEYENRNTPVGTERIDINNPPSTTGGNVSVDIYDLEPESIYDGILYVHSGDDTEIYVPTPFVFITKDKNNILPFDVQQTNSDLEYTSAEITITDTGSTPEALASVENMYIEYESQTSPQDNGTLDINNPPSTTGGNTVVTLQELTIETDYNAILNIETDDNTNDLLPIDFTFSTKPKKVAPIAQITEVDKYQEDNSDGFYDKWNIEFDIEIISGQIDPDRDLGTYEDVTQISYRIFETGSSAGSWEIISSPLQSNIILMSDLKQDTNYTFEVQLTTNDVDTLENNEIYSLEVATGFNRELKETDFSSNVIDVSSTRATIILDWIEELHLDIASVEYKLASSSDLVGTEKTGTFSKQNNGQFTTEVVNLLPNTNYDTNIITVTTKPGIQNSTSEIYVFDLGSVFTTELSPAPVITLENTTNVTPSSATMNFNAVNGYNISSIDVQLINTYSYDGNLESPIDINIPNNNIAEGANSLEITNLKQESKYEISLNVNYDSQVSEEPIINYNDNEEIYTTVSHSSFNSYSENYNEGLLTLTYNITNVIGITDLHFTITESNNPNNTITYVTTKPQNEGDNTMYFWLPEVNNVYTVTIELWGEAYHIGEGNRILYDSLMFTFN